MPERSLKPLEFRNVLIFPNKDFIGFSLSFKGDRPGVLKEIGSILESRGLNVNYIYGYVEMEGPPRMLMVVDVTGRKIDPAELVDELERIDVVERVHTFDPIAKGFVADTTSFPLTIFGERIIMLRKPAFKELLLGLLNAIGPQATVSLLYQVGVRMGRGLARKHKELAKEIGIDDPIEVVKRISVSLFQSLGYGLAELELEGESIILKKRDCIECTSLREILQENMDLKVRESEVHCGMVRGMIEGVLSEIFGEEFASHERKCIARGDEYCELVLTRRRA